MSTVKPFRFICPDTDIPEKNRIALIEEQFEEWINNPHLQELIYIYGGRIPKGNLKDKLIYLEEDFLKVWDYRAKQKTGRSHLSNDDIAEKNCESIYSSAGELGFYGIEDSLFTQPDYILPLGGAGISNLRRCQCAFSVSQGITEKHHIVGLSTFRKIQPYERSDMNLYAPQVLNEYESMACALEVLFKLKDCEEEMDIQNTMYLSSAVRHFFCKDSCREVSVLAAPSSDCKRRADIGDCFRYFLDKFEVQEHTRLLNCTGQIYVPYQQIRSLTYAVNYNVCFDTIGFSYDYCTDGAGNDISRFKPVHYLQEIKAVIDAMHGFCRYFDQ